ncbi:MAG: hypothetical protein PUE63_06835, partial [Lachnospiraceae bacterium]|nr:hypothetical protein [Lachnospiraceae bacterium]
IHGDPTLGILDCSAIGIPVLDKNKITGSQTRRCLRRESSPIGTYGAIHMLQTVQTGAELLSAELEAYWIKR